MIGERHMPAHLPSEAQPIHKPETTQRFDYDANAREVTAKLERLGIAKVGDPIGLLNENGIDRTRYISYARQRLLPGWTPGTPLPEKIGSVQIPKGVRKFGQRILGIIVAAHVGYGHERVGLETSDSIALIGGRTKDFQIGGDKTVFHKTKGVWARLLFGNLERAAKSFNWVYTKQSMEDARAKGMAGDALIAHPENPDPYPKTTRRLVTILGVLGSRSIKEALSKKAREEVVRSAFALKEQTPEQVKQGEFLYRFTLMKSLAYLFKTTINQEIKQSFNGEQLIPLIIATHAVLASAIGQILEKKLQQFSNSITANFQPDKGMIAATHTHNPRTYVPNTQTIEKWELQLQQSLPHTVSLEGFPSPLSVYARDELLAKRQQALRDGQPITVVATASGVALAQLGAFSDFMKHNSEAIRNDEIRFVVQCGSQDNDGQVVYKQLLNQAKVLGIENKVVLHLGKDHDSAIRFFDAISWTETPLSVLVKGSEMASILDTLNVHQLGVGALGEGGHEIWNLAARFFENPYSVSFPSVKLATEFKKAVDSIFRNDPLIQEYLKQGSQHYSVDKLLQIIDEQTIDGEDPQSAEKLREMVERFYNNPHTTSQPNASLTLLESMLKKRFPNLEETEQAAT